MSQVTLSDNYRIDQYVRINNKKNFLLESIPDYYPGTRKHSTFWKGEIKKCVEGFWSQDKENAEDTSEGDWRFMPPNLYFYVNHGSITFETKGKRSGKVDRPDLRDLEWEIFYNYELCKGFSGFNKEPKYSCNVLLKENLTDDELKEHCYDEEGNFDKERRDNLFKENGERKEYVPAKEYIRKLHDDNYGNTVYFNPVKNLFILGTRGLGKSYSIGVGLILHTFLFDGMSRYNLSGVNKRPKRSILVGAPKSDKSTDLLNKTFSAFINLDKLIDPDNLGNKKNPLSKIVSGTLNPNNAGSTFRHRYKKKVGNQEIWGGTGTEIKHVTYTKQDPSAGVGGRYILSVIEEIGLLENIIAVHAANENTQRLDDKFGVSVYIGTGGEFEKIIEAEQIFRNPKEFTCLDFDDVYEETGKIGWFIPYHYSRNKWKDQNGNTDLEKAHKDILKERKEKRSNPVAYQSHITYLPIKPSEMFTSNKGSIFPAVELKEVRRKLAAGDNYKKKSKAIKTYFDPASEEGVSYIVDEDAQPLYHSTKYDDLKGCPLMYEEPIKINGKVPDDMYIAGLDPFWKDYIPEKPSLGSFWIMKNYNYAPAGYGYSQIVLEYTARPEGGHLVFNTELEKLLRLYNIGPRSFFVENDKGENTLLYFKKKPELMHMLGFTTSVLNKKTGVASNPTFGVSTANHLVKKKIIEYLYEWLIEERTQIDGVTLRNMDIIPSIGLVEELIKFDWEGNFDRVMGFAMAIIGLRNNYNEHEKAWEEKKLTPLGSLANNNELFQPSRAFVPY